MNTSIKLIEQASSERWIKPLALFHLCKYNFVNSVIFDYRKRMNKLARHLNVSTKTFYSYLTIWRDKGLIEKKGNNKNLHLASIKSIKYHLNDKRRCKVIISSNDDLYHITCKLFAKLIENHFRKMAFAIAIKEFGRRDLHKMRLNETAATHFSLSIRNIAKLLNISKNMTTKVLKTLEELKILKIYLQKPVKISDKKLNIKVIDDYPGYKFITDKGTFLQFGSKIELIQFPVEVPIISFKVYLKYYKLNQCKFYDNY